MGFADVALSAVDILVKIIYYVIIIQVLLSWVIPYHLRNHPLLQVLDAITDPIVEPCRSFLSRIKALNDLPLDFAPILAITILLVGQRVINAIIFMFAY